MRGVLFIILSGLITLVGFGAREISDEVNWLELNYEDVQKSAENSKVSFYMWGGDARINSWVDGFAGERLLSDYGITLHRVAEDASIFVNKLITEKQAGRKTGSIDIVWINGENFKNAKQSGVLFGPFLEKLPNYKEYIDPDTVEYDFGYPVEGYEAPYGRAQFVFEYDAALLPNPPDTYEALSQWIKNHPGEFTYPQPPSFTGSAFIRQVFYAVTGGYEQYMKGYDEELYLRNAAKLWRFLNEIKPYLWQEGKTYPKEKAALDLLFQRGEVTFNMSYHQADAFGRILDGLYKPTVRTFVMKDGSIYNTHFTAIPFNAPNKPGAMVVANFLMSPVAQYEKNLPENWGDFTVIDITKLSPDQHMKFSSIDMGEATLPQDILNMYAVPEISSEYVEKLEDGWEEYVLKG